MQFLTFKTPNNYFSPIPLDKSFPYSFVPHTNGYHTREQMHTHDCIEIGLCKGGSGLFFIGGGVWPFMEGSISVIAAGTPHIAQNSNDDPSDWVFLNVGTNVAHMPVCDGIVSDTELGCLFQIALQEFALGSSECKANVKNLVDVFLSLYGRLCRENRDSSQYSERMNKILPALELVARKFSEEITSEELARACYLNPNYFRGVFRTLLGCTPTEYINRVRLRHACLLLKNTSLSVSEVAEKTGFLSFSTFNRLFKRALNCSPTHYRAEEQNL